MKHLSESKHYIGIDVGGTKIQTSLITEAGLVAASHRRETPRNCPAETTIQSIEDSVHSLLAEQGIDLRKIAGIGIAVPGVVQQETGFVVVTPNMNLTGTSLAPRMESLFNVPVAVGNDCNLGTLGEYSFGSGRNASSCIGIFIGTGIGAGIVVNNELLHGAGQSAGEIGHIVTQIPCEHWQQQIQHKQKKENEIPLLKHIPRCGCGNYGCFESLASRTAIERDIRDALESGEKSCIKITDGIIKSGAIAKALKAEDKVTSCIMRYASQVIGYACLTVRHLLDPEVIVLGGGVMEACQTFMMPIIEKIIAGDQLASAESSRRVLLSSLGDNAVVLGAAALVRSVTEKKTQRIKTAAAVPHYPLLQLTKNNAVLVEKEPFEADFFLLPDGSVLPREKLPKNDADGFRLKDIETATQGGVDLLILISPKAEETTLSEKCSDYLHWRNIDYRIMPMTEGINLYNTATLRRSAVIHF